MISFELDDEVKALQETAKKFAENEIRPLMRECEKAGDVPESLLKKYHELGMSMLDCPESACGMGCPLTWNIVLQEELGWGDAGIAAALGGPGHAGPALMVFGTPEQRDKYLAPFAEESAYARRGTIALLEDDKGQEFWDMQVSAKKKGDKWEINGKKAYVINGPTADLVVVFARVEEGQGWNGIRAFAVEKGTSGMVPGEPKRLMGLNAVKVSDIVFDECAVPEGAMLTGQPDTEAGIAAMMDRIRCIDSARLVGMARAACEYAINYSQERVAFGKPIGHFQALAFLMSDMATEVNASRWMVWRAGWAVDNNHPKAHTMVAKAVAQTNEMSHFVTNNAVQILGGHGFIQDHPVEKWMRDARSHTILFGQTHLQNLIIAGEALAGGKKA